MKKIFGLMLSSVLMACSSNIHVYDMPASSELTEEQAVNFSRRAMLDSGIAPITAKPVPFDTSPGSANSGKLFARNAIDPQRGYVLWKTVDDARAYDHSVFLQRRGDKIECEVARSK